MAMFNSLPSWIKCPFSTCYKLTTCCCYIGQKTVGVCTTTAKCSYKLCANTTICCLNLCKNTGNCCASLCSTTYKFCTDCCQKLYSACCCCNCCCPDDGGNGSSLSLAKTFPPLGVYAKYKFGIHFWICLLLTIIGYLPGLIYALFVLR